MKMHVSTSLTAIQRVLDRAKQEGIETSLVANEYDYMTVECAEENRVKMAVILSEELAAESARVAESWGA